MFRICRAQRCRISAFAWQDARTWNRHNCIHFHGNPGISFSDICRVPLLYMQVTFGSKYYTESSQAAKRQGLVNPKFLTATTFFHVTSLISHFMHIDFCIASFWGFNRSTENASALERGGIRCVVYLGWLCMTFPAIGWMAQSGSWNDSVGCGQQSSWRGSSGSFQSVAI